MPYNASSVTSLHIVDVFMQLVASTHPTRRVTVVQLTKAAKIDRTTFYKHFENIDILILWIMRSALTDILQDPRFNMCKLVTPAPELNDPWPTRPFYFLVDTEHDKNFETQRLFFKLLGKHFQNHRPYYEKLLASHCYTSLFDYIMGLFTHALKDDIALMLDGCSVSSGVLDFLAEYHSMGIFGRLGYRYAKTRQFVLLDELDPYYCYGHMSLQHTIDTLYGAKEHNGFASALKKRFEPRHRAKPKKQ